MNEQELIRLERKMIDEIHRLHKLEEEYNYAGKKETLTEIRRTAMLIKDAAEEIIRG